MNMKEAFKTVQEGYHLFEEMGLDPQATLEALTTMDFLYVDPQTRFVLRDGKILATLKLCPSIHTTKVYLPFQSCLALEKDFNESVETITLPEEADVYRWQMEVAFKVFLLCQKVEEAQRKSAEDLLEELGVSPLERMFYQAAEETVPGIFETLIKRKVMEKMTPDEA